MSIVAPPPTQAQQAATTFVVIGGLTMIAVWLWRKVAR